MKHEKVFKRPDGCRVKVIVSFSTDLCRNTFDWNALVLYSEPGKRKWKDGVYMATPEEIIETAFELHNLIKPKFHHATTN